MTELDEIHTIATEIREIFERMLQDSINTTETHGSCLYASILLSLSLNQFTTSKSQVCGGGPEEGAGLRDKNGKLQGHYWVEGTTFEGEFFLVDITADQFGYRPVIILSTNEVKGRYVRGNQERIESHVKKQIDSIRKIGSVATSNRNF